MLCTSELYIKRRDLEREIREIEYERYLCDDPLEETPAEYYDHLDQELAEIKEEINKINSILLPLEELV